MVELKKRLDSDRDLVGTNVSLHPLAELSCIAAWCSCMCFCDKPSSLLLTEVCRMVAMTVFGTVVGTTSPWIGHRHMNFHFCCVTRNVPIVPVAEDYVSPSPSHSYISSWKDGEAFILSKSKHRFVNSGCCSSGLAGTNSQITDQKCFVRFVADALLGIAVSRFLPVVSQATRAVCQRTKILLHPLLGDAGWGKPQGHWLRSTLGLGARQEEDHRPFPIALVSDPSNPCVSGVGSGPSVEACRAGSFASGFDPTQLETSELNELTASVNREFTNQIFEFHLKECCVEGGDAQFAGDSAVEFASSDFCLPGKKKKKKPKSLSQLNLVSFNGNSWSTIKSYISTTSASIVCCQEHKLVDDDIVEAKLRCRTNGWQSFFCSAFKTRKGGKSAGSAVLVRAHVQAWVPESFGASRGSFWPARSASVMVHAGGIGPVCVVSC